MFFVMTRFIVFKSAFRFQYSGHTNWRHWQPYVRRLW